MAPNGIARRRTRRHHLPGWLVVLVAVAVLALPAAASAEAPSIATLPALLDKSVNVGDALDGTPIVAGTAPLTITYQWQTCDGLGQCTDLAGQTNPTYTATSADVGFRLQVVLGVTNGEAPDVAGVLSGMTAPVQVATPRDSAPTLSNTIITGTAAVGQTLTAQTTSGGEPAPALTYLWDRCTPACNAIGGATAQTYDVTAADSGVTLRVTITATNTVSSVNQTSDVVGPVPLPPQFVVPAGITGTATVGQTLTVGALAIGLPPPAITYEWQRCTAGGSACAAIGGANASTYTLVGADAGGTVKAVVHADSTAGSAASEALSAVVAPAPQAPQLSGLSIDVGPGTLPKLTASVQASGVPAPSVTYAWFRCDVAGANCGGAIDDGAVHTAVAADLGHVIRVVATATNPSGIDSAAAATPVLGVAPAPPKPDISGPLVAGSTVQANATVSGAPAPTVAYQWRRCTTPSGGCTDITGAAGQTYTLTAGDVGLRIRVRVTVSNAIDTVAGVSDIVGPVAAPPAQPVPTTPPQLSTPTISGIAAVGQTMIAAATVTGSPQPTLTFQWQRCDAAGGTCADIAGANGAQRTVLDLDRGSTLRVVVRAANGTAPDDLKRSDPTGVVQGTGAGGALNAGSVFDTTVSGTGTTPPVTSGGRPPLAPFPQVRIRGKLVKGGARVTLFSVTAPVRTRISVRCTGRGCPRSYVTTARRSVTRVRRFERFLRAGVRLTVRISRTGYIGKYSSFQIRDRKAPVRHDLCLSSPTAKPVKCAG